MLQNQIPDKGSYTKASANVCFGAQRVCLDTARYAMDSSGEYADRQFIRLLLDTAALCHAAMDANEQVSWLKNHALSACAAMCARVAEACDKYPDDERMIRCARTCRDCVKYCIEVNTATVA